MKILTKIPSGYKKIKYENIEDEFMKDECELIDEMFFEYPHMYKLNKKNEVVESYQFWNINGINYKIVA